MNIRRFSFFITLFIVATSISARVYQAPLYQSEWTASSGKTQCQLRHEIPRYGNALFELAAGEQLTLSLAIERTEPNFVDARISDFPSKWMHSSGENRFFPVQIETNLGKHKKLIVRGDAAETMLTAMVEGRIPTFSYSWTSSSETSISLSSVNFFQPYDKFAVCRQQLLPFSQKDIQDKVIFFDNKSKVINSVSKQTLDLIGSYLSALGEKDVVVGSEAAKFGGKTDKKWFDKRFQVVKAELAKRGVNAKRIKLQYQLSRNQGSQNIHLHLYGPETSRYFGYHRKQISVGPKSKFRLNKLAQYLIQHFSQGKIVISAHTDNVGKRQANKKKSRRRAAYIRDYLKHKGVSSDRMTIKAYGESKPRYSNRGREGQARNRRSYIELIT